jgi:hypothetical protein
MKFNTLSIIFIGIMLTCNEISDHENNFNSKSVYRKKVEKVSILIQPFDGLSISTAKSIAMQLIEIYREMSL